MKMRLVFRSPAVFVAAMMIGACAADNPETSTPRISAAPSSVAIMCAEGANGLSISDGDPAQASASLNISPDRLGELEIFRVERVSGSCAHLVHDAMPGQILLSDGNYYASRNGEVVARDDASILFDAKGIDSVALREWDQRRFVDGASYGVKSTGSGSSRLYVGVWSDSTRSAIGTFMASSDGTATAPVLLLASDLPIRGVSYFPDPDTRSGLLSVVQEQPDRTAHIIAFRWQHD
ncbi:hypothetical protein KCG44_10335 [Pacificimonas sp. WHA3]|uniref:Lipoprotein n=1 Tax=Pacificimonas pallii TaxID=2827236 RepID=A0ABS6SFK1_9SPHN|nr:hypothetical protein [Pacificimonas pallii]MBV7257179.1 hypothetical protein [Pacificimonas pallii]